MSPAGESLTKLSPAPYNPRKATQAQFDMLSAALIEFGDLGGIVFNRRTQRVIGGHQRLKVLADGALDKFDVPTESDGTVARGFVVTEYGKFSYREVDWDERKEVAANIAANKHGGDWDMPKLKALLVGLDDGAFDMKLTGFEESELKRLFDWKDLPLKDGEAAGGAAGAEARKTGSSSRLIRCPDCNAEFDLEAAG